MSFSIYRYDFSKCRDEASQTRSVQCEYLYDKDLLRGINETIFSYDNIASDTVQNGDNSISNSSAQTDESAVTIFTPDEYYIWRQENADSFKLYAYDAAIATGHIAFIVSTTAAAAVVAGSTIYFICRGSYSLVRALTSQRAVASATTPIVAAPFAVSLLDRINSSSINQIDVCSSISVANENIAHRCNNALRRVAEYLSNFIPSSTLGRILLDRNDDQMSRFTDSMNTMQRIIDHAKNRDNTTGI